LRSSRRFVGEQRAVFGQTQRLGLELRQWETTAGDTSYSSSTALTNFCFCLSAKASTIAEQ
jgi:hypothetical protein